MAKLTREQMIAALKAAGHDVDGPVDLAVEIGSAVAAVQGWCEAKASTTKSEAANFVRGFKVGYIYQRKLEV